MPLPGLDVAADVGLAAADVDDVGVGRRDGDGADGGDGLVVEDRLPVHAAVGRLPDAAGRGGGVVGERIAGHAAGAADAPAGRRADAAELEALELGRAALGAVLVVGAGGRQQQGRKEEAKEEEGWSSADVHANSRDKRRSPAPGGGRSRAAGAVVPVYSIRSMGKTRKDRTSLGSVPEGLPDPRVRSAKQGGAARPGLRCGRGGSIPAFSVAMQP